MEGIEEIGSQPQSSDTSELSRHASFLGSSAFSIEADPEDTAPSGEESNEEASAQTEDGTEQETPETESASPQLPAWIEDFTTEDVAKFKARYPSAFKRLSDPNTSRDDEFLIRDKMNDFLEIQRLRAPAEEEPTLDDTQTAQTSAQPQATEEQRKQYYEQISNIVSTQLDPQSVATLGTEMLEAMGVDVKSTDPEIQAIVKNAPKLGSVLAKGALDLMATTLPSLLGSRLEASMPGITEMYFNNVRAQSWESLRSQAAYSDLPAMGTPEWGQAIDKVLTEMPELREMYPNLNPQQRIQAQYKVAARLMTGQKLSPADAAQTAEAAKQKAAVQDQKRKAGKALGAGKAKANISAPGDGSSSIMTAYNSRNGNSFGKR